VTHQTDRARVNHLQPHITNDTDKDTAPVRASLFYTCVWVAGKTVLLYTRVLSERFRDVQSAVQIHP